jgi:capsular exopolysaccharide synthesis family protein
MSLDIINEAFRIVRTNLEFILGYNKSSKVIMITSLNPGAGKTFVSANLAAAIGVKDKRVLIIDLDLRRGSLSRYVGKPQYGVSSYLSGQETDYRSLVVRLENTDVLPCGIYPPNPTELLSSQRFDELIEAVRSDYDYILIDCPPIEVVADAKIINRCVDMTLFIVRARLFERSMLPIVEQWYEQKVYNNMAILLNGTSIVSNSYGYHRYGYYGGYHYGKKKIDYGKR